MLAVAWHPGGANSIIPVIKKLRSEDKLKVVVLAREFSKNIFDKAGIEYKEISSYEVKDVSLESVSKILEKEHPDLLLSGTSNQNKKQREVIEQNAVLAAKMKGIPTLAVLDFWGNYWQRFSDIFTGEKFKFLPDKIAIIDEFARKEMTEEGFEEEKLIITGNPHFEYISKKIDNSKKQKSRINLPLRELVFLYAGNAFKDNKKETGYWDLDNISLIVEVLKESSVKNVSLIIKPHPRLPKENIEEIRKYTEKFKKDQVSLIENINTYELISISDLVIVAFSTIGLEAVFSNKPVISIQPGLKEKDPSIISKKGIIPAGYNKEDCKLIVKKALDENYRKKIVLRSQSFKKERNSTEKIKKLVYAMI